MKVMAIAAVLLLSGCTTMGRTTTNEQSLLCIGFCFEQGFESQVEIVQE
jgi:hypothetical protein